MDLRRQGISEKKIKTRAWDVNFYLNDYLCYMKPQSFEKGLTSLDDFFGYFFIRKCVRSDPYSIKKTSTSIKMFYKSMRNHGVIRSEDYQILCDTIMNDILQWEARCAAFNKGDPNWLSC